MSFFINRAIEFARQDGLSDDTLLRVANSDEFSKGTEARVAELGFQSLGQSKSKYFSQGKISKIISKRIMELGKEVSVNLPLFYSGKKEYQAAINYLEQAWQAPLVKDRSACDETSPFSQFFLYP